MTIYAVGVLSVFGQQLDYVSSALKVLDNSSDNQYGIRGQPHFDKVGWFKNFNEKNRVRCGIKCIITLSRKAS